MPYMTSFNEKGNAVRRKIVDYLKETGDTQRQIARYSRTSQVTVWSWLNGKCLPEIGSIMNLAKYYDIEEFIQEWLAVLGDK